LPGNLPDVSGNGQDVKEHEPLRKRGRLRKGFIEGPGNFTKRWRPRKDEPGISKPHLSNSSDTFFIPSPANGQPTKITEVRPELKPTKEARHRNPLTPQKHFLLTETGRK
jgi:hypothetical protein